jgi:ADP-ribose pyrophosphatase
MTVQHDSSRIDRTTAPVEVLYRGKYLTLAHRGGWEFVARNNPQGAVIIIAVTPDDTVLMVEQFRVPLQSRTLEFPAGLIGDLADTADENWADSARRELLEETGWEASDIESIMAGPSSAGMTTEIMRFVRASGLRRVHAGGGDASEDITVHEIPRDRIAAFVLEKMQHGYAIDPKVYAGLYFLTHDLLGHPQR